MRRAEEPAASFDDAERARIHAALDRLLIRFACDPESLLRRRRLDTVGSAPEDPSP